MFKVAVVTFASVAAVGATAQAVVIDTFSDTGLPEYTQTLVLDQDATNGTSFSSPSGALQATKPSATTAEQNLFFRNDHSLDVGEILRVDAAFVAQAGAGIYADFGIAVGAAPTAAVWTSGTASTRSNYVAVYVNTQQHLVKSIGWDGAVQEPGTTSAVVTEANVLGLYISHPTATEYLVGYTTAAGDVAQGSFTLADPSNFTQLGFFTDIRGAITTGTLDNLRVDPIPEPAALGVLGLAGMGVAARRRRA